MRVVSIVTASCIVALSPLVYGIASAASPASGSAAAAGMIQIASAGDEASASLAGFAFVDSAVTGQGSRAKLPSGTKIYPPGSKVTGTDGCPTTRYRTDGLLVLVIDYQGRPTAGSVAVTRRPAAGGRFEDAPYYLDLDSGRTLQYLGPIFGNGSYDVLLTYHIGQGQEKTTSTTLTLARDCRPGR